MTALAFPEEVQPLLEEVHRETGIELHLRERLAGRSGAWVFLVDAQGKRDGLFILKIDTIPTAYEDEAARHEAAERDGAFRGRIPQLVQCVKVDDQYALLLELAGGSRIEWRPVVESIQLLKAVYARLGDTLWTPQLMQLAEAPESGSAVVKRMLGYMITPDGGGRIQDNASTIFGEKVLYATGIAHLGFELPNPIRFAMADDDAPVVRPMLGPCHGDCHADNVMARVNMDAAVMELCMIDLASYRAGIPTFYDLAYFELATLLRKLRGLGEQRWFDLADTLACGHCAGIAALQQQERAWAGDLLAGRTAVLDTAASQISQRYDDLRLQLLLAQVAAGLAFINKVRTTGGESLDMGPAQYQQALVWSAVHLRRFLKESRSKFPADRAVIIPLGVTEAAGGALSDAAWSDVGGFDDRGFNIAVLSGAEVLNEQGKLAALPWSLVVDFGVAPPAEGTLKASGRSVQQSWPNARPIDTDMLERGTAWFFANGRTDISDAPPANTSREWRRTYYRPLQDLLYTIAEHVAPTEVRVLVLGSFREPRYASLSCEAIDAAFADRLKPIIVSPAMIDPPDVAYVSCTRNELLHKATVQAAPEPSMNVRDALVPQRTLGDPIRLMPVPLPLFTRIERDLTLVHRNRAASFPRDRIFGVDFRRGMRIEWAELAQRLDVDRSAFQGYRKSVESALRESTNATINLRHEPSAGGSTLARRLAWELMEEFPVVILKKLTTDTAAYIRDLFQYANLPVLVVMESEIVTESAREALLRQMREDNTRAVFLWVTRVYGTASAGSTLKGELSLAEAQAFLAAYREQVTDPARHAALNGLLLPKNAPLRSPFFFGLTGFEESFIGLDRLVEDTCEVATRQSPDAEALLADLALASFYSGEGFPKPEFLELCRVLNSEELPFDSHSPFAVVDESHVRIPHRLIAERTLDALARTARDWGADRYRFSGTLLAHLRRLRNSVSDRTLALMDTLFVTRDMQAALEADADVQEGAIPLRPKFSPLIMDLSTEHGRALLSYIFSAWPSQPHYAVHYARHLLFRNPQEIDQALQVALAAERAPQGANDDAIVHMVGMCYRVRLNVRLSGALAHGQKFGDVESGIKSDFEAAVEKFQKASRLNERSEYGHVTLIQTASSLLRMGQQLAGSATLDDFVRAKERRWCLDVLSIAEDEINALHNKPQRKLSGRANAAILQWRLVYGGNIDRVIARLRELNRQSEDPTVRRALCNTIMIKHEGQVELMPQGDLATIAAQMDRNIEERGVRDSDIRTWFRAYRHLRQYDPLVAIRRLVDWAQLNEESVEAAFYLHVLYVLQWLNSSRANSGYADEARRWLEACVYRRKLGFRGWGYEWLIERGEGIWASKHFRELSRDPVETLREGTDDERQALERELARVEGTIIRYRGPQQAQLDLGDRVTARFVPLDRIVKEDEGKRAAGWLSFSYDGPVGRDVQLVT